MAIYHLSTKPISRSSGRSAVASIAYRAGIAITDERLGKTYDYSKRHGVLWTGLATPNNVKVDRNELWNLAEKSENRSNSRTAREIVINIPHELMQGDLGTGNMLAHEFASQLSKKYQVAVDVAVHAPDKQGDNRNFHAHLLLTTRKLEQDRHGKIKLTDKSQLEMSNTQLKQAGLLSNQDELKEIRKAWADLTNDYLAEHGIAERIDHRSHKDRGLETLPTVKMGWQATELERQGICTDVGNKNRDIKAHNANLVHQKLLESEIIVKRRYEKAQKSTLEPRENKQARVVPAQAQKPLRSENRGSSEPKKIDLAEKQQIVKKYAEKVQTTAKAILDNQLKALREKAKPILEKYNTLKDNKPLLFGKDKWEWDTSNTLKQYNAIKNTHDSMKDKGVTDEHIKQAIDQIAKQEPLYHAQVQQAIRDVKASQQAKLDKLAREHGADKIAQNGNFYYGKIIKIDDKGAYQQTNNGIVLHPTYANSKSLILGKSYDLDYRETEKTGQVYSHESYEVRLITKNHEQIKQR